GKRYFAVAPVQYLHLESTTEGQQPENYTKLAEQSYLSGLRTLDCYTHLLDQDDARTLFASAHLAGLKTLYLGEGNTTPEMVTLLSQSNLSGLRELYLWDFHTGELGDNGLTMLAGEPFFAALTRLDLLNTGAGTAGAVALASSPHLRLRTLSLGRMACGYAPN